MSIDNLEQALVEELKDLLSAEKQLTKALPKMAKKATNSKLQKAFEMHLGETEKHVDRLEQALEALGQSARAKPCEAMKGLIEEGRDVMQEDAEDDVMDAMLIAAAQKVEHYEIASYGTACTWAEMIGNTKALKLLKQNMADEEKTDQKLTQIAESVVNREALAAR